MFPAPEAFFVTIHHTKHGRIYRVYHCCDKRYINVQQLLAHLRITHGDTPQHAEERCADALLHPGEPVSPQAHHEPHGYVREVCTCAAGQPECHACEEWRKYHHLPVALPKVLYERNGNTPDTREMIEAKISAATNAYELACDTGDMPEAYKQRRRMSDLLYKLKRVRT